MRESQDPDAEANPPRRSSLVMSLPAASVFDDFLSPEDAATLWKELQSQTFYDVNRDGFRDAFRISDGQVLAADPLVSSEIAHLFGNAQKSVYPCGTALDVLFRAVRDVAEVVPQLIGEAGVAWDGMTARSFVYPRGAGLSWHSDNSSSRGTIYRGAYIYYAHPYWNCQWGGELILSDVDASSVGLAETATVAIQAAHGRARLVRRVNTPNFDNERENDVILENGLGRVVMPKPNRLVVLSGKVLHRIMPVLNAAGDNYRVSVAGFFVKDTN